MTDPTKSTLDVMLSFVFGGVALFILGSGLLILTDLMIQYLTDYSVIGNIIKPTLRRMIGL